MAASFGQRNMKWERGAIVTAAKGATTLAEVRANVARLQQKTKNPKAGALHAPRRVPRPGAAGDARAQRGHELELQPGLNVMDLTDVGTQTQAMVIRAALEHINQHEKGVLTVFPEAWEFAPRGRSAPAKDEAIAMARKGAVLGNFLLCDSQDLAGVDTVVRQAASVWLLGVQRELNELKRTLQMIPAGVKRPKPEDVAQLELGQFYVCWGRHAIKTYVQPTWIESEIAVWVATGRITADSTSICQEAKHRRMKDAVDRLVRKTEEDQVNAAEAGALRDENARLARDNEELRRRLTVLERSDPTRAASDGVRGREETERSVPGRGSRALEPSARGSQHVDEALYQAIKARLIEEAPGILVQLRASRPELEVTVTRKTLTLDEFSLKGRIARLLKEGFFAEPRGCGAVRSALKRTGPDANTANIGRALDEFTRDGFVTDEGSGYREVLGMKVNIVEGA
jgi:hypothetical protein